MLKEKLKIYIPLHDDNDEPTWSNLYVSYKLGLEYIVETCEQLVLTLPDGLLNNVVNVNRSHYL